MPRVSIITALYNHAPFLAERVRSILRQSMTDFEWIAIDDCSPDDSYAVMLGLTEHDARVKLRRNPANLGFTRTVQRGLDEASGDFVYIADSDDSCDLRFLAVMSRILDANPAAGFAYCRGLRMDVRNGIWGGFPKQKARYFKAPKAFPQLALGYHIRQPTLLYRRAAIERVGGFAHPRINANSDWYLALRLALHTDVVFHPQPLGYHRTHGSNMSGNPANGLENFILLEDVFAHLPDPLRHFQSLRQPAYRAAAIRMRASIELLRKRGPEREYREIAAAVQTYVPEFDALPESKVRRRALQFAHWLVKLLTYRPVEASSGR